VGILKAAATVAEASTVHGRVKRLQREQFKAQARADAMAPPPAATPPAAPPPGTAVPPQATSDVTDERLAQLARLGDLKNSGVLTDAEFEQQKARILTG